MIINKSNSAHNNLNILRLRHKSNQITLEFLTLFGLVQFISPTHHLQRTNPNRTKGCSSNDCLTCKHGRGKGGECRRNNVGYVLSCDLCGADEVCYVGETGQNAYTRGLKHMANYRGKQADSPLWKHAQMAHGGSIVASKLLDEV